MFHSLLERIRRSFFIFMQGRYGGDALSLTLLKVSLLCWAISLFFLRGIFTLFYYLFLFVGLWRIVSKNHAARRKELAGYLRFMEKINSMKRRKKRQWDERKTHRFFKCRCGAILRVPKGKGKIKITCRICQHQIIRRT